MSVRQLDPPALPRGERRSRRDRHLLALSGGGYRGLFTASVLAEAEQISGRPLASRFDMIAGTSIGGILAIALACEVSAQDLVALMLEHGSTIFKPRRLSFSGISQSHYDSAGLRRTIELVLGHEKARRPFSQIPVPLVVTAVHERSSRPHIFRTDLASNGKGDAVSTIDVALATSAAPTFFPPHSIDGETYVDGGLAANAPDVVLLTEAMRLFACSLAECQLLSIGSAGLPRAGSVNGAPGKIGWVVRHALVDLLMSAQEALAIDQVRILRPGGFLRVDETPPTKIILDDVKPATSQLLIALAQRACASAQSERATEWRRFMAHISSRGAAT